MTENELENWEMLKYRMDAEGFHYCFTSYSNFEEIKDVEFHKMREMYIKLSKQMEDYVDKKCDEEIDY